MPKLNKILLFIVISIAQIQAQTFTRSELPTKLNIPWEICYGPDNYLWITEANGILSRVNPINGNKQIVFTAPDYFQGSSLESSRLCFKPKIGAGTHGLALHPEFNKTATAFLYMVYSYNHGTTDTPKTQFKIVRLHWNSALNKIDDTIDLVKALPTGFDHFGGRLICVKQKDKFYLYYSAGDNGISEDSEPLCYIPQTQNPNNFAQDPNYKNGKIHRFYIDGSIPEDNPLPANSFYTRGHRNPQGLIFNTRTAVIYDVEHGDRTDDEINLLEPGKNYGWKNVRGFHSDDNYPGEANYVTNYTPYPGIKNDSLCEPIFAWCATAPPSTSNYLDWCTVAPSDGYYYDKPAIPQLANSLLIVTLKNGQTTNQEMQCLQLSEDGRKIIPTQFNHPNPLAFFEQDQSINGRLRDLTFNTNGDILYLINNGGANRDKITIYTYTKNQLGIYPNPARNLINIDCNEITRELNICTPEGNKILNLQGDIRIVNTASLPPGMYILRVTTSLQNIYTSKFIKE